MLLRRNAAVHEAHIDLATVRETIAYIQDDLARSPRLARVGAALAEALAEIDKLQHAKANTAPKLADQLGLRFTAWTPDN